MNEEGETIENVFFLDFIEKFLGKYTQKHL